MGGGEAAVVAGQVRGLCEKEDVLRQVAAAVAVVKHFRDIGLDGHQQRDARQQRDEKPQNPLFDILPRGPLAQRVARADSRDGNRRGMSHGHSATTTPLVAGTAGPLT